VYSVSIFKSKQDEELIMIPFAKDESGIRRNVNKQFKLTQPYSLEIVGQELLKAFAACYEKKYSNEELSVNVYELITGIKSFPTFSKNRDMVSARMYPNVSYKFIQCKREKNGAYKPLDCDFELSLNASLVEIGETLLKAFEQI